jgi:hypothetical protein
MQLWQSGNHRDIVQNYGLGDRGFDSEQGLRIFFFTTASRPALKPIQPPIQWVPGGSFSGSKVAWA